MVDKFVAMNIDIARTYAGIVADCGAGRSTIPEVREASNEAVRLLKELGGALKRLAGAGAPYNRCWDQCCRYLKLIDSHQVQSTEALLGKATLVTSPKFGAKGYTLFWGEDRPSGVDELRALNAETREMLASVSSHFPKSFWSRLFGGKTPQTSDRTAGAVRKAEASASAKCASCAKPVRPFSQPGGAFVGTLAELANLKVEPDHALVCGSCHAIVCPVCLGREAGKKGARQFVCPQCGHMPVDKIYRV